MAQYNTRGIWNEGGFGTRPYRFPLLIFYSFSENDFGKDRGRILYFFVYLRPIKPPKTFSGKLYKQITLKSVKPVFFPDAR